MDKDTRNDIREATEAARKLLTEDFAEQLLADFNVHRDGRIDANPRSPELTGQYAKIVAAIQHKRAAGFSAADAVADYLRDAAFTTLNRFAALKMLEARELVQQCVTKGEDSSGYGEFCGLMPGLRLLPNRAGYRLYIESLFDELSTEVKVLFDRRDPAAVLWPRRQAFDQLLILLNDAKLAGVWREDETIGWVYQYFNSKEERAAMRDSKKSGSQAPRNSRELAVRNQFFTPRYVVQFLTDNTLGRIWYEMRGTKTLLVERCEYLVRKPDDAFAPRAKKDPRDLRVIDPACGSGHFLLYAFDLLLSIYEEAYVDAESPPSQLTGQSLATDYPSIEDLRLAMPALIIAHNLHGVDIDPRCAQIAQLALWMRAQRAFRDLGIRRDQRVQIRKSNIVVAEPLIVDEATLRDFLSGLKEAELGRVFATLIDTLRFAGDLGLLLRLETLMAANLERNRTGALFAPPEARIRAALHTFVRDKAVTTTRRLFVDDAAQGIGLLEVAERRYDILLMNPPFGLPTERSADYINTRYSGAHTDLYSCFCARACELTAGGLIGAITSRSFLVNPRHEVFRGSSIIPNLRVLLDLGLGVMDGAAVEAAAFVLAPNSVLEEHFLAADAKANRVSLPLKEGLWKRIGREAMKALPGQMILYSLPPSSRVALQESGPFEPDAGTAREGMKSFGDFRFIRAWWEVAASSIGWQRNWKPYAKGGGHAVYFLPSPLCLNWKDDGAELRAVNLAVNGSTAQVRQASTYWGRSGATYSRRSTSYSARALPSGYIFATMGPAVLLEGLGDSCSEYYLLGWLNSRFIRSLIELQANKQNYLTGIVKRLPWKPPAEDLHRRVVELVRGACVALRSHYAHRDSDPYFAGLPRASSLSDMHDRLLEHFEAAEAQTRRAIEEVDREIDAFYGMAEGSYSLAELAVHEDDDPSELADDSETIATKLEKPDPEYTFRICVSVALGVSLGRWSGFTKRAPNEADCLIEPPFNVWMAPEDHKPLGILSDDIGTKRDAAACIAGVLSAAFARESEYWLSDGIPVIRSLLRDGGPSGLFAFHCREHSGNGRKAPAYWQLATPSANYSIWLCIQSLSRDTLFLIQEEYAASKLSHESRKLESLRLEHSESPSASQRRTIAEQEDFVDDLRGFLEEVRRVTPLWNPNLDDGVLLNFAPLWRLVPQNRAWQKELKATWDGLCNEEYDWAHLAMHLWPERVVPKCATDRSLAIAHGLEAVFWVQGTDGKWTARTTPTRPIAELVQERSSPAVKAALTSLVEAPAAAVGRGKCGRAGKTITLDKL